MFEQYGMKRVMETKGTLPVLAWRLDNRREIQRDEMRIKVTNIHLEAANFKQIRSEAGNDETLIAEKILSIVSARGKLHNPYTNTAGIVAGTVDEIGADYHNEEALQPGDSVVALYSLSMIPLHIDRIHRIDFVYGNVELSGYCVLYNKASLIRQPADVSLPLLMVAFEESASLYHVHQLAKGKEDFLIVGSNVITSMLYGSAIRKRIGNGGRITALLAREAWNDNREEQKAMERLIRSAFDDVLYMDLSSPVNCAEAVLSLRPQGFDLSINCAETIGGEAINVLSSREKGTVFFPSLINNYNIALFLTEGLGKELEILCADGYARDYNDFMFQFLGEISSLIEKVRRILDKKREQEWLSQDLCASVKSGQRELDEPVVGFVARSPSMKQLLAEVAKAAKYDCPVLIQGETGVGKEKVADLIHSASSRKMKPCIKINCAAIPASLMESEFFGYEKGAFTGAGPSGKKGYLELADKGILFLDEVEQLPLDMQAKLLRVLQDKSFYSVGGQQLIHSDFRVVAAANKDLMTMVGEGRFREDLYYRLCVLNLYIPPLRSRTEDIFPLTKFFVAKYCERYQFEKVISDTAISCLKRYSFPGNIRELENLVQRLLIHSEEAVIDPVAVLQELYGPQEVFLRSAGMGSEGILAEVGSFQRFMEEQEKSLLQNYLLRYKTTRKAAEALHMSQAQFMRKKKKYNL